VFAVKRGEVKERLDVTYNDPKISAIIGKIAKISIPFGKMIESISGGATPLRANDSQYSDEGINFLRIQNVTPFGIDLNDVKHIVLEIHNGLLLRSQLATDDLLMTITGRIGTCSVVTEDVLPANINQHIVRIRLKSELLPEFVACYLNSDIGQKFSNRGVTGTTRIALDYESIKRIPVPLIDKQEQRRLVEFMNVAACSRSEKLREADALLSGMSDFVCEALKISLTTEIPKLGVGVTIRQLKADKAFNVEYYHAERTNTIAAVKAVPHKRLGDCVYFIRDIVSVNDGQYLGLAGVQSNTGELSGAEDEATGQAFVFQVNDVLYCRLRPYLNKVWKAEYGGVCSTEFHVLRVKCNGILPEYLATVMRSTLVLNQSRHMMTGNTHPRITNDDVANLLIPMPDILIQQKIADEMKIRRDNARALRTEAETEWAVAKVQFERELLGGTGK